MLASLTMPDALAASVQTVAAPWADSDYYRLAKQWIDIFWHDDGPFRPLYDQLDKQAVIELAVGYGWRRIWKIRSGCCGRAGGRYFIIRTTRHPMTGNTGRTRMRETT